MKPHNSITYSHSFAIDVIEEEVFEEIIASSDTILLVR